MIYINYLFIYSLIGFIIESTWFKILKSKAHSGIFYGPYTFVYGFGVLSSILLYEWLEKYLKEKNKYLKLLIYFIIFTILLTLIEYIGGHILKLVFDIDMWNYTSHKFHFGKYICLELAFIWGLLGTFNIYFLYPKIKKIIDKIPSLYTYLVLFIFLIDFIMTIYHRLLI